MGFPDELRAASRQFYELEKKTEATLRRALSTAYYALFHLLIESACNNWPEPQRNKIARQFDHRRMKEVSENVAKRCVAGSDLFIVTDTFVHLQEVRHAADYDLSVTFSVVDVGIELDAHQLAFEAWGRIKTQTESQDYLFSLLFRDRRA
jgi:hypothetical protein